jgi:glucose/arabinose dehydrogenase
MNDRTTPVPRPTIRPRAPGRVRATLAGALVLAALIAPGSASGWPAPAFTDAGVRDAAGAPGGATGVTIALDQRVQGLDDPVFITDAGDGTNRYFIVEQTGRIKIWVPGTGVRGTPFLNLSSEISTGGERGLLGLAFHPNYETNRRLYVYLTRGDGDIVIREYKAKSADPNRVKKDTRRQVLRIEHSANTNHNGGMLVFGPDGYLYLATGDGGSSDDPNNNGQRKDTLLGKMLRIDVDGRTGGKPYGIPPSNPYVGEAGKNEIWQRGLRNPWRFSFDAANGNLWIGDVGQDQWEEVDRAIDTASGPGRGINWGWDVLEGTHCHEPSSGCNRTGKTDPVTEYANSGSSRCAVTGGYVYRGTAIPALQGSYVFADYCTGEIFSIAANAADGVNPSLVLNTSALISSFGERPNGELFVVDRGGRIYQVVPG